MILGDDNVRMLNVARKLGTNLAAICLSTKVRMMLPAWYHPFTELHPMTSANSRCLLRKHKTTTVADLVKRAKKLNSMPCNEIQGNVKHSPRPDCTCRSCTEDRREGCSIRHACTKEALTQIHKIALKYNPLQIGEQHDNLSLTPHRKSRNIFTRRNDAEVLFNPTITCKDSIVECFHIFTDESELTRIPARRIYARVKVPGPKQSNQVGELATLIEAIEAFPTFFPININMDSRYVINRLTLHLKEWEDDGWIGIENLDFFKHTAYLLKKRTATTTFQ